MKHAKRNGKSWRKLTRHWLNWALSVGGYNIPDIARKYNVTSQCIQQITEKWGIRISKNNKSALWHANNIRNRKRSAKKLANKDWMLEQLRKHHGSIARMAHQLKVSTDWLRKQLIRLEIDIKTIRNEFNIHEIKICVLETCNNPINYRSDKFCCRQHYYEYRRGRPKRLRAKEIIKKCDRKGCRKTARRKEYHIANGQTRIYCSRECCVKDRKSRSSTKVELLFLIN